MNTRWISFGISVAIGVSVLAASAPAASQDKIDRQFESISRILEKADKKREAGDTESAGQLYGATIAAYQEFHRNFPDAWVELIQFRIAYCRNQLMSLLAAKRAAAAGTEAPAEDKPEPMAPELVKAIAEGIEHCRNGRYKEAEAAVQAVIETTPNCGPAYLILGTACAGNGDIEMATTLLQRAVALAPDSLEAHYNLAQLLIRAEEPDFDAARAHYRRAVFGGAEPDRDLEAVLGLE